MYFVLALILIGRCCPQLVPGTVPVPDVPLRNLTELHSISHNPRGGVWGAILGYCGASEGQKLPHNEEYGGKSTMPTSNALKYY